MATPATLGAGLNEEQTQAVFADPNRALLVLAGAGTGKTTTLVHRIAHVVSSGVMPHCVLAVTFTNKAAEEMRTRVTALIGPRGQSINVQLLHIYAREAAIDWNSTKIASESQTRKIVIDSLRYASETCGVACTFASVPTMTEALARWQAMGRTDTDNPADAVALQQYYVGLTASGCIDFAGMVSRAVMLLRARPDVLQSVRQRYTHVFVDEFQDTSALQYELVRLLGEHSRRVTVVGDDDQSIYSFRGADVGNFAQFRRDFQPAIVRLERNFRCTAHILAVARAVVEPNQGRDGKVLQSLKPGKRVLVRECDTVQDEMEWLADKIARLRSKHAAYRARPVAVLFRSLKTDAEALQAALQKRGLSVRTAGSRAAMRPGAAAGAGSAADVLAYFRLAVNEHHDASFERVLNVPPRGIGPATLDALQSTATARGLSLSGAAQFHLRNGSLTKMQQKRLDAFMGLLSRIRARARKSSLPQLVDFVVAETGMLEAWQRRRASRLTLIGDEDDGDGGEEPGAAPRASDASRPAAAPLLSASVDATSPLEPLQRLRRAAEEFSRDLPPGDDRTDVLALVSRFVALQETGGVGGEEGGIGGEDDAGGGCAVVLSTVHRAKGLEWPVVFVPAWNQGVFPSARGDEDEERRIAHVACTRAMERLVITYARQRGDPSSFALPEASVKRSIAPPPPPSLVHSHIAPAIGSSGSGHVARPPQRPGAQPAAPMGLGFTSARSLLSASGPSALTPLGSAPPATGFAAARHVSAGARGAIGGASRRSVTHVSAAAAAALARPAFCAPRPVPRPAAAAAGDGTADSALRVAARMLDAAGADRTEDGAAESVDGSEDGSVFEADSLSHSAVAPPPPPPPPSRREFSFSVTVSSAGGASAAAPSAGPAPVTDFVTAARALGTPALAMVAPAAAGADAPSPSAVFRSRLAASRGRSDAVASPTVRADTMSDPPMAVPSTAMRAPTTPALGGAAGDPAVAPPLSTCARLTQSMVERGLASVFSSEDSRTASGDAVRALTDPSSPPLVDGAGGAGAPTAGGGGGAARGFVPPRRLTPKKPAAAAAAASSASGRTMAGAVADDERSNLSVPSVRSASSAGSGGGARPWAPSATAGAKRKSAAGAAAVDKKQRSIVQYFGGATTKS